MLQPRGHVSQEIQKDRKAYFGAMATVPLTDSFLGWNNLLVGLKAHNKDDRWAQRSIQLIERTLRHHEEEGTAISCGDITITVNATTATVLCWRGVRQANGLTVWNGQPMKPREMMEYFDDFEDYLMEVL
jgi:hypothetical protein